jgi:hypothetical protein
MQRTGELIVLNEHLKHLLPMRSIPFLIGVLCAAALHGQQGLVINEVQAANRTTLVTGNGRTPDWIELYNPDRHARSLKGMRLRSGARVHHFEHELRVPGRGHLLLYADEHLPQGPEHLGFRLDRSGGSLLLLDSDGSGILDVFTYGDLPTDRSMGRIEDGSAVWSLFTMPTPGRANMAPDEGVLHAIAPAPLCTPHPGHYATAPLVNITVPHGCSLHLSTDGSPPDRAAAMSGASLTAVHGTMLRAITRCPGMLASEELAGTYTTGTTGAASIAIIATPDDLWSPDRGILVEGLHDNHSRGGEDWERRVLIQRGNGPAMAAGMRVSGSGSRSLAKRSLKLHARDRHGSADSAWTHADGSRCDELMLRADASPHAFLSNLLMEVLVERSDLALEQQPSQACRVLLNGQPWGLYRMMPPKDAQWLQQRSGADAVDVLEGPSFTALSGDDAHFRHALEQLERRAPLDSLNAILDVGSLIDLACVDLFTGRADHDLNVRCYRPRQPGGRWRWVLFDLDLWSPHDEPVLTRMMGGDPHAAPFLPLLMQHPELQPLLLGRISTLLATTFRPAEACRTLDSLFHHHRNGLEEDHARWLNEVNRPAPAISVEHLRAHLVHRPASLMQQLAAVSGRRLERVTLDVPSEHEGRLLLNGRQLPPGNQHVAWLSGVPAVLELIPDPGYIVDTQREASAAVRMDLEDLVQARRSRLRFRSTVP